MGNITTGTELIRRTEGGEAYALTCPLSPKPTVVNFGKTESGNVWLDPIHTPPTSSISSGSMSDADAEKYIKIFTDLPARKSMPSVAELRTWAHHQLNAWPKEVTTRSIGSGDYEAAVGLPDTLQQQLAQD